MKKIALILSLFIFLFFTQRLIAADNNDCTTNISSLNLPQLQACQADLQKALDLSLNATRPLQSQLDSLQTQVKGIKNRVATIEIELADKKIKIDKGQKEFDKLKSQLDEKIVKYYIDSYNNCPICFLLSSSIENFINNLAYQQVIINNEKDDLIKFAILLRDLDQQKKDLESEQTQLVAVKASLDEQSAKLDKIVSGARAYQGVLSGQIAQLSAKQQEILGQRLSDLGIPLFAYNTQGGCSSDLGKSPGFSDGYGFFTYGVPNRVGLNQYGAKGRADAGQNSDTILHAYYNFDGYQNFSGITINVNDSNGFNSGNIIWSGPLEDYVKRIYEVPNDWPAESLRAQVIAARSYVLAATNNGAVSICANQNCQVFQTGEKGGAWSQAVSDTAGQVMIQGGNPVKAWFSSTHGGYVFASGDIGWSGTAWTKRAVDTSGPVNSFSDLQNNAYDKASKWFYCDWGSRSSYNGTAWLTSSEVADIINTLLLVRLDPSTGEHLYQVDKPNKAGTDTWDEARVRSELQSRGTTPYNSVSGVTVAPDFTNGMISSVTITGDAGTNTFSGTDFKNRFDLRAKANIQIVGPLFNVERP